MARTDGRQWIPECSDYPPMLYDGSSVSVVWHNKRLSGEISLFGSIIHIKCFIKFHNIKWRRIVVTHNLIRGVFRPGQVVKVWHCITHKFEDATIYQINDCSRYIVRIKDKSPEFSRFTIARKRSEIQVEIPNGSLVPAFIYLPLWVHPVVLKLQPYHGLLCPLSLVMLTRFRSSHPALIVDVDRENPNFPCEVYSFLNNKNYILTVGELTPLQMVSFPRHMSADFARALSKTFYFLNGRGLPRTWEIPEWTLKHFTRTEKIALLGKYHPQAK